MGIMRHADIRETLIYAPYSLTEGRMAMGVLDKPTVSAMPIKQAQNNEWWRGRELNP